MKKASISEARNNLSALIDGLKSGSSVLLVDRGRPVARLEPVGGEKHGSEEGRLARLLRDGLVRPRRSALTRGLLGSEPPTTKPGASALDALLEERREGR
jgi:antitoxin (DNA-binding transcriptional repressor) of toxin-antitoxin stability system